MAALNEGRRFVGVELSEHFCEVTAKRLAATTMRPEVGQLDLAGLSA